MAEQATVTLMLGELRMGQVELAELVTTTPQMLVARTLEVLLTEQALVGTG